MKVFVFNNNRFIPHIAGNVKIQSINSFKLNYSSRDPSSLIKPIRSKATPEQENQYNERLEAVKPTAVRHLILIRHGQYNLDGETDGDRFLTEVGRKQAAFTGDRLKLLDIPFDVMVRSTMTRAQETGKIISSHIANIPIENCSLIEEGAPIAPQPPIGHWCPEPSVSLPIFMTIFILRAIPKMRSIPFWKIKNIITFSRFNAAVFPRWSSY